MNYDIFPLLLVVAPFYFISKLHGPHDLVQGQRPRPPAVGLLPLPVQPAGELAVEGLGVRHEHGGEVQLGVAPLPELGLEVAVEEEQVLLVRVLHGLPVLEVVHRLGVEEDHQAEEHQLLKREIRDAGLSREKAFDQVRARCQVLFPVLFKSFLSNVGVSEVPSK